MGLEQIGEIKKTPKGFEELELEEKKVLEEIQKLFKRNADLSAELLSGDQLNLTEHQKRYLNGQLKICGRDAKETLRDVKKEEEGCHYYKKAI